MTEGFVSQGYVAPGFEPVERAFAKNFVERGDVGASVCVYRDGVPVVDLWGGVADVSTGTRWSRDSIVTVFSMTKGVTAIAANLLVQRGLLDPAAPVASYWPEFAAAGKADITVGTAMSHRAGLPRIDRPLTRAEALAWDPVVAAIAAQEPIWEPGSQHGYHMRSYGWIAGELIRRVTGRSPGRFIADDVCRPIDIDFHVGLPESEEARLAALVVPGPEYHEQMAKLPPEWLLTQVISGPSGHFAYDEMWNTRELRAVELPSSNGVGNARAVARLYAHCIGDGVSGVRLLDDATVAAATAVRSRGPDSVILVDTAFGIGFMLPPALPTPCGPRSFGHGGAGGSSSFADPDAGIAFAYTMNKMSFAPTDARAEALARAVYRCLS
jgi:CubicO group peptidase (beta-lactamase class C family)